MFCQHCGKSIDDGTKFCPYCGNVPELSAKGEFSDLSDNNEEKPELIENLNDTGAVWDNADLSSDGNSACLPETEVPQIQDETQQPVSDAVKAVSVRKQKHSAKKAGTGATVAVCALFMVVTLVLTICTSSMWAAREILSDGMLSDMVSDVDPLSVKVGDLITDVNAIDSTLKQFGITEGASGISADDTVGEIIENSFKKYGLTEDKAEQFLEESALLPYVSEVVKSYENYLLTGEDENVVKEKKLKAVILDCIDYSRSELGIKFADDTEAQIDKALKENKDIIRSANPTNALGAGGKYIRYIFFMPVLIAASVITIAAAALAGVITKRADAALITLGVPTVLFGGVFLFTGLFPRVILSWAKVPNALFGDTIEEIGAVFTKIGLAEFVTGIVLIAAFVLCKIVAKKMADKAVRDNSSSVQNV